MSTVVKPGQLWKYGPKMNEDVVTPYRQVRVVGYSNVLEDQLVIESISYPSMTFTIPYQDFINMWELDAVSEALDKFDSDLEDLLK
jgi:hypothetical protein